MRSGGRSQLAISCVFNYCKQLTTGCGEVVSVQANWSAIYNYCKQLTGGGEVVSVQANLSAVLCEQLLPNLLHVVGRVYSGVKVTTEWNREIVPPEAANSRATLESNLMNDRALTSSTVFRKVRRIKFDVDISSEVSNKI